jgi:hypothetical protein
MSNWYPLLTSHYIRILMADKYNWANDSFYNISLDDMLQWWILPCIKVGQ